MGRPSLAINDEHLPQCHWPHRGLANPAGAGPPDHGPAIKVPIQGTKDTVPKSLDWLDVEECRIHEVRL